MPLLSWKPEYAVGIAAVDHEHRQLIDLINRLHDRFAAEGPASAVTELFGDLLRAISAHFALEEQLMRQRGYARLVEHKLDHERLLDEIRDLMDEVELGDAVPVNTLASRLDHWFTRHFAAHDAPLHRALAG